MTPEKLGYNENPKKYIHVFPTGKGKLTSTPEKVGIMGDWKKGG